MIFNRLWATVDALKSQHNFFISVSLKRLIVLMRTLLDYNCRPCKLSNDFQKRFSYKGVVLKGLLWFEAFLVVKQWYTANRTATKKCRKLSQCRLRRSTVQITYTIILPLAMLNYHENYELKRILTTSTEPTCTVVEEVFMVESLY